MIRTAPPLVRIAVGVILLAGCAPSGATPTASPSQPPSVSTADSASADLEHEFLEHVVAVSDALFEAGANFNSSFAGNAVDQATANLALANLVSDERQWLRTHQPAECYRESWQRYVDILDQFGDGSVFFSNHDDLSAAEAVAAAAGKLHDLTEASAVC